MPESGPIAKLSQTCITRSNRGPQEPAGVRKKSDKDRHQAKGPQNRYQAEKQPLKPTLGDHKSDTLRSYSLPIQPRNTNTSETYTRIVSPQGHWENRTEGGPTSTSETQSDLENSQQPWPSGTCKRQDRVRQKQ